MLAKDELLTSRGISINAADPGWCRTDMGSERAPRTSTEGGHSIAWNVEEKDGASLNGTMYSDGQVVAY